MLTERKMGGTDSMGKRNKLHVNEKVSELVSHIWGKWVQHSLFGKHV